MYWLPTTVSLSLTLLEIPLAIMRLPPDAELPSWAGDGKFLSVTRTPDEISLLCPAANVPEDIDCRRGFRALAVEGPLAFEQIGVLAALAAPLAEAQVSIFVISTWDTDYLLVAEADLDKAVGALRDAGHGVSEA